MDETMSFFTGVGLTLVIMFGINKCIANDDLRDCIKNKWDVPEVCKSVFKDAK